MNSVAIFRRGAWLVAGALLFSVPSTHAVMDSGQQQTPDFGVIQFTDDEAFINLPVALSDAWSKTLEVLAAMNPAVKADLPYLENNGRIISGDLWVAVETQGDTSRSWAHIRVAIPAGGGDAARTRAEILLDAIADRLEPQKVGPPAPPPASDQPALPPAAEGLVDQGSTEQQPVYNTYNYYYGSEPYSSSYAQPDYGYASYVPAYSYAPYYSYGAPCWNSGWGWNWGFSACWGNFCSSWGWWWGCNPCWWHGCGWNSCWNNSCGTTVIINNNVPATASKATVLTPRVTTLPGNNQGSGATAAGGRGPIVRGPGSAPTTVVDRPVRRATEPSKPVVVRQTDRSHDIRSIVVSGTDRTPSPTPRIVTTTGGSTTRTGTSSHGSQRNGPTVKLGSAPYGARVPVALPTHELDQPRSTGTMGGATGGGPSAPAVGSGPSPANGSGGSVSYPAPVIRGPSSGGSSGSAGGSAPTMSAPRPAPAPAPRVDPPRASAPAPRPAPAPMPAPAPAPRPAPMPSPAPSMGGGGHGSAGPIGGGPSGGSSGGHGGVSGGISGGRPR